MKKQFKEYYGYTDGEIKKLWDNCVFVFDTNTLLNMYRYKENTTKEYFDVLNELGANNRIFLPHQVGKEFFDNRMDVIREYSKSYDDVIGQFEKFKAEIEKKYSRHPYIDFKELAGQVEKELKPIVDSVKRNKERHPDLINKDTILKRLTTIFNGLTGEGFGARELDDIYKEGEVRYESNTPPGYKDSAKGGSRQYGDLVIWKEMLNLAKAKNVPIIFISGDVKEDWWQIFEGKRIMPHPLLKREMLNEANVEFHIYTADRFLSHYKELSNNSIGADAIDDVKRIRELDEARAQRNILVHGEVASNYNQMPIDEATLVELMDTYEKMATTLVGLSRERKDEMNLLYRRAHMMLRRTRHTRSYSPFIHRKVSSVINESAMLMYQYENDRDETDINDYGIYESSFTDLLRKLEKMTRLWKVSPDSDG